MKYCSNCGAELDDNAVICPKCGCAAGSTAVATQESGSSTLRTVAFVFMIIGCIVYGWTLIPLLWLIPMTVHLNNARKNNLSLGVGYKICVLLFVNIIAGICLLVDKN